MTGKWGPAHRPVWQGGSLLVTFAIAALLLLMPLAAADQAGQELEMELPLNLAGSLDAQATNGAVAMGPFAEAPQEFALRLQASQADVTVTNLTETSTTGNTGGERLLLPKESSPQSTKYPTYRDAQVRLDEASTGFYLLAHSKEDASFSMEPLSREATLDNEAQGRKLSHATNPTANHHTYSVDDDMLGLSGNDPFTVITGDFTVLLFETSFVLDHEQGSQQFETGESHSSTTKDQLPGVLPDVLPDELPVDPMVRKHAQFAVMELQDARLAVRAVGPEALMVSPLGSLKIDVDGVVESPSLLGSIRMNDETVDLQGDPARMEGRFTMQPTSQKGENRAVFSFNGDVETLTVGPEQYQSESTMTQAAGLAIILAGVGATVWHVTKSGLLVPLYAKLTRRKVLDQATRQNVHDKVMEDPGCTTRTVASALRISWSTAAYHLRVLRHMGLITAKRQGRHDHHFVMGGSSQQQQLVQAALQNPTTRRIAQLIKEHPGIIQKDVCEHLGIAPSTASDHLRRLRDAGAVQEERQWRTRAYHPAQVLLGDEPKAPGYEGMPMAMAGAQTSA